MSLPHYQGRSLGSCVRWHRAGCASHCQRPAMGRAVPGLDWNAPNARASGATSRLGSLSCSPVRIVHNPAPWNPPPALPPPPGRLPCGRWVPWGEAAPVSLPHPWASAARPWDSC
ncbi:ABC transporter [Platysternon megacephalum]|uniref:ABC transporter n=1 Tax=Platysternon megacephalum TaxID=55544 RepID=A0A4D9DL51_9SAUR|nr:ABC transporter [Platysternon megacephalum]